MQYHTGKKRTFNSVHSQTSPYQHHNIDREAHHSPTWHSSESESALERFEPVAVVQQLPDGRGTLFVAPRRRDRGEPTPTRYNPSISNRQDSRYNSYPVNEQTKATPALHL